MLWRRTPIILAMLTALLMAPSTVFGAPPNEMRSATVTPPSGTTDTPFRLTASYVSTAGNPASAVTATFGTRTVPLSLTAGTPVSGVWTATTQLPAGTWRITFQTSTAKGPKPTQTATVTVTSPSSASPSAPVGSTPSADVPDRGDEPSGSGAAAPTASGTPADRTAAPRATSQPAAGRTASPAVVPASPGTHGGRPDGNGGSRPSTSPRAGARPNPDSTSSPVGAAGSPGGELTEDLNVALLVGTVGVAALALLIAGWIAIGGARPSEEEAVADSETTGGDPAVAAIAAVERRALRRARLRASDDPDPILAALGLPEGDAAAEPAPELEGRLPRRTQRVRRKR